jgi:hypothetical protein
MSKTPICQACFKNSPQRHRGHREEEKRGRKEKRGYQLLFCLLLYSPSSQWTLCLCGEFS